MMIGNAITPGSDLPVGHVWKQQGISSEIALEKFPDDPAGAYRAEVRVGAKVCHVLKSNSLHDLLLDSEILMRKEGFFLNNRWSRG